MWYEMTQKKDLIFFPIPEELRQKLVKENGGILLDLPFRYMQGVGDAPIATVGFQARKYTAGMICRTLSSMTSPKRLMKSEI